MRGDTSGIREHMPVDGSAGRHAGTVGHLDGPRIGLTRTAPQAEGIHRLVHMDSLRSVEDGTVRLDRTTAQAEAEDEGGTSG